MIFLKQKTKSQFDKLYDENSQKVRGVLYRMLMEKAKGEILDELEQEVFIKVWSALAKFQFQSQISTWVYRISVNTAIDYLRKEKGNLEISDQAQIVDPQSNTMEASSLKLDIQNLLQKIDEKHRAVLILYYFEDRQLKEIAKILEIELGTVKSRLNTARKKAAQIYQESKTE